MYFLTKIIDELKDHAFKYAATSNLMTRNHSEFGTDLCCQISSIIVLTTVINVLRLFGNK